jgi:hypothetical protein
VEFLHNNPLLKKAAADFGVTTRRELDAYDSEVARDLMYIHDEIMDAPVRDFDPMNSFSLKRYFNFTFNGVGKLIVAIERALDEGKWSDKGQMLNKLDLAKREMNKAEVWKSSEHYEVGAKHLEHAFMLCHGVIDSIRRQTRQVPKVRSLMPSRGVA